MRTTSKGMVTINCPLALLLAEPPNCLVKHDGGVAEYSGKRQEQYYRQDERGQYGGAVNYVYVDIVVY